MACVDGVVVLAGRINTGCVSIWESAELLCLGRAKSSGRWAAQCPKDLTGKAASRFFLKNIHMELGDVPGQTRVYRWITWFSFSSSTVLEPISLWDSWVLAWAPLTSKNPALFEVKSVYWSRISLFWNQGCGTLQSPCSGECCRIVYQGHPGKIN